MAPSQESSLLDEGTSRDALLSQAGALLGDSGSEAGVDAGAHKYVLVWPPGEPWPRMFSLHHRAHWLARETAAAAPLHTAGAAADTSATAKLGVAPHIAYFGDAALAAGGDVSTPIQSLAQWAAGSRAVDVVAAAGAPTALPPAKQLELELEALPAYSRKEVSQEFPHTVLLFHSPPLALALLSVLAFRNLLLLPRLHHPCYREYSMVR